MSSRPLSPHLQIYRWYLSMALSIGHRASGIAMVVGILFLVWWLLALATGPESFATVQALQRSIIGQLALFGWTLVIMFHSANGVRHLVWDFGFGFEPATARRSGMAVLAFAGAATLLLWIIAYAIV